MDHGTTHGPVGHLADARVALNAARAYGADAIVIRPGLIRSASDVDIGGMGLILALTGRLLAGPDHVQFNSVSEAHRLDADAVALELKLGSADERPNAAAVARLAEEAHQGGLPVVVMIYPVQPSDGSRAPGLAHACRVAEELGADIVKTLAPRDPDELLECLRAISVPLVIAGGAKAPVSEVAETLSLAVALGAAGGAVGRAVWMSGDLASSISTLRDAVHGVEARV
jgi:DhnA family fructose-bisphosphate aldolase class Ia